MALARTLRLVTSRLPHRVLDALAGALLVPADAYARACDRFELPLTHYMRGYFSKLDRYSRKLVIYDQLNPRLARYYRREELEALLADAGFVDVRLYHRMGYSWSALARWGAGR